MRVTEVCLQFGRVASPLFRLLALVQLLHATTIECRDVTEGYFVLFRFGPEHTISFGTKDMESRDELHRKFLESLRLPMSLARGAEYRTIN